MTPQDKRFLDAVDIVLVEINKGDPAARTDELASAVALLDAWLQEQRARLPEPDFGELVKAAHRALRADEDYRRLLDAGDLVAAAQMIKLRPVRTAAGSPILG